MRISQQSIKSLAPQDKPYSVWCSDLKGFGVRVNPSGAVTFISKYRIGDKQQMMTIGRSDRVQAEAARKRAKELMGLAAMGVDQKSQMKAERKAATVAELADRFLKVYCPHHIKPSTRRDYTQSINRFILPQLGKQKVRNLDRTTIAQFHESMASTPYQANRVLSALSVMLSQAEVWGMRPESINPCSRVKRFREKKRERFLSSAEIARLAQSLEEEAQAAPMAAAAFRLLILTGCRKGEIQTLEWRCVDFEREEIRLDDSKTGQRTIYLSPQGIALLKSLPRKADNPYVITGHVEGQHLTDLERPWRRVRSRASLDDVRIHDLRHTFAANAAASGLSLPMIGKLLGHTQAQTTARYAHLAADPVRKANADVARLIAEAMKSGRPNGN
jgi:integrase